MTGRRIVFLTHAQVEIDPGVPVPDWGLSAEGQARHAAFAASAIVPAVSAIYASAERKAREGAAPVALRLGLPVRVVPPLGENDRASTGFLPPPDFERMADRFFAEPDTAVEGWERARAAQARITAAIGTIAALDRTAGDILIVAHGAVGALWRCHLKGCAITRAEDQPAGGGCWFETRSDTWSAPAGWSRI